MGERRIRRFTFGAYRRVFEQVGANVPNIASGGPFANRTNVRAIWLPPAVSKRDIRVSEVISRQLDIFLRHPLQFRALFGGQLSYDPGRAA